MQKLLNQWNAQSKSSSFIIGHRFEFFNKPVTTIVVLVERNVSLQSIEFFFL